MKDEVEGFITSSCGRFIHPSYFLGIIFGFTAWAACHSPSLACGNKNFTNIFLMVPKLDFFEGILGEDSLTDKPPVFFRWPRGRGPGYNLPILIRQNSCDFNTYSPFILPRQERSNMNFTKISETYIYKSFTKHMTSVFWYRILLPFSLTWTILLWDPSALPRYLSVQTCHCHQSQSKGSYLGMSQRAWDDH